MSTPDLPSLLAYLSDLRALFRDELKKEPAVDWYVDVEDLLTHAGITPADRERSARALIARAGKRLKQVRPDHPALPAIEQLTLEAPK